MRALVLSDVHANLEALQACLEKAPSCDLVINLGDIVGYGASPNETVELSREACGVIIRGNHDKACVGLTDVSAFNPVAAMAVEWTHEQLTEENLTWLRSLPSGPLAVPGMDGVQVVHGSPRDEDEYVLLAADAADSSQGITVPITFFGHTHIQGGFHIVDRRQRAFRPEFDAVDEDETWETQLQPGGTYLINPGSVGQPRDNDWRAGFAVFDSDSRRVTFSRVVYDLASAQSRILQARLPQRLADRLAYGR